MDISATARGSAVRYSKSQQEHSLLKPGSREKEKSGATYRKKLRCTYIKPDEELRLK